MHDLVEYHIKPSTAAVANIFKTKRCRKNINEVQFGVRVIYTFTSPMKLDTKLQFSKYQKSHLNERYLSSTRRAHRRRKFDDIHRVLIGHIE